MALIRNAANMIRQGRVGETTYYVSGGQQIARQARNDSNFGESARRSEAQQSRRVLWANLVNFYKVSQTWMPKAFETKKRNQSDYNKFMAVNINSSTIALTKEESAAGACVIAPYIVSQGSLPSIEMISLTDQWRTNIAVGSLVIDDSTTNAQLTAALEESNANVRAGMQLSFVSYQQSVDALGTPRAICRCYEITLSRTSSELVRTYLPTFCSQSVDGYLGTSANISVGGFAYILSGLSAGGLKVSTQQLVSTNELMTDQYSSPEHIAEAVQSYGLDTEVILSPSGTNQQEPEGQPLYIQLAVLDGVTYMSGAYVGPLADLAGKSIQLNLSAPRNSNVTSIRLYAAAGEYSLATDIAKSGKIVTAKVPTTITGTASLISMVMFLDDGTRTSISFSRTNQPSDLA